MRCFFFSSSEYFIGLYKNTETKEFIPITENSERIHLHCAFFIRQSIVINWNPFLGNHKENVLFIYLLRITEPEQSLPIHPRTMLKAVNSNRALYILRPFGSENSRRALYYINYIPNTMRLLQIKHVRLSLNLIELITYGGSLCGV